MYDDSDFVGMTQCFYCGEAKDILIDKFLRKKLPMLAVYDREPCDKCKALMAQGVMLISVAKNASGNNPPRTGCMAVVTDDAIRNFVRPASLAESMIKSRVAFVPDDAWDMLGLPRENIDRREHA